MEDKNKVLKEYLDKSILSSYLTDSNITDISYNGVDLFIENRVLGRTKIKNSFNNNEVSDFLSHISNICGKNFNSLNPILDISFLNYRLNAVHPLIAKSANQGVYTFALRIYDQKVILTRSKIDFCPVEVHDFLSSLVLNRKSILISGKTGVGKTEFQKYLVGYMENNTKIVLIEDLYETYIKDLYPNLDVTSWVSFDNQMSIEEEYQKLIKASLRNNPDWLIIAEVRGKEAKELYNAFSSGHPFIATIHSMSAKLSIKRFAQIMGEDVHNNDVISDIAIYIPFSIHLNKKIITDGSTIRYIESIVENIVENNRLIINEIYNTEEGFMLNKLSKKMIKELGYKERKNE